MDCVGYLFYILTVKNKYKELRKSLETYRPIRIIYYIRNYIYNLGKCIMKFLKTIMKPSAFFSFIPQPNNLGGFVCSSTVKGRWELDRERRQYLEYC